MNFKVFGQISISDNLVDNKNSEMSRRQRRESETDVLVTSVTYSRRSEDDIQVVGSVSSSPAVVDLTVDLTSPRPGSITPPMNEIVDLTEPSPDVFLVPSRRSRRLRHHVMQPSQRDNILHIVNSDDSDMSDGEVEEVTPASPYNTRSAPHRTPPRASTTTTSHSSTSATTPKRVIVCPICMEDEPTIRANGQQLTSTTCGHVFCNQCIRGAITTQHKCPTCRKKLTLKQIHPIFI